MGEQACRADQEEMGQLRIRDLVQALTGGRPYIFVIMAYDDRWDLYERIKRLAEEHFGVTCVRADEIKSSGYDLLEKIHLLIKRSEFVIAEISKPSANVYYEVGYTVAVQERPLLLIESGNEVPADLSGLETVEYRRGSREAASTFETELVEHLRARLNCETGVLRDLLEAPDPYPAYIVASPKYPTKYSRVHGQVYDMRTFGDGLGILGLISAFASVWGVGRSVELVSGQHTPQELLEESLNLYLIGSDKVNPHVERALPLLQRDAALSWVIDPVDGYEREGDWPGCLYRCSGTEREAVEGRLEDLKGSGKPIWTEDYGLIVRGPHPFHRGRLVMVVAGAHSLGTGAACIAATRPERIREIKNSLPDGVLEDKNSRFWVLVKGAVNREDGLLDPTGVTIQEAGIYESEEA